MRILGLDIGNATVKAVEVDTAFSKFEVHDYHEAPVVYPQTPIQTASAVLAALKKRPDKILVSLPAGQSTFRIVDVPTRDKKAIRAAVQFELEDDVPFDLETALVEYATLQGVGKGARIYAATTLKKYPAQLLAQLGEFGIDPDLIIPEAWAYRVLMNRIEPPKVDTKTTAEPPPPVLVLNLGHFRTTLYAHWNGNPILCKEIQWGGRDLSFAIQSAYQVQEAEAERIKRENGFILTQGQTVSATREQMEFSNLIAKSCSRLMSEIRTMLFSARDRSGQLISKIYVAGGTSLLPGLRHHIEEQFAIPTLPLKPLGATASGGVAFSDETEASHALSLGLALTMVGAEKAQAINFRKGDLARQGSGGGNYDLTSLNVFKPLAGKVVVVLGCLLLSLFVQSWIYQKRSADLDTALEKSLKGFFGDIAKSAIKTHLANPQKLKKTIEDELSKQRDMAKLYSRDPETPLAFLKTLSVKVPKGTVVVDLVQTVIGSAPDQSYGSEQPKTVKLTFLVESREQVTTLTKIMESLVDGLQSAPIKETLALDKQSKRFEVTYTGIPRKAAYGR